jgi:hypothetical protein
MRVTGLPGAFPMDWPDGGRRGRSLAVSRLVSLLTGETARALRAIRSARTAARERAWALTSSMPPD